MCTCDEPDGWPLVVWHNATPSERRLSEPGLPWPVDVSGLRVSSDRRSVVGACPRCDHVFRLALLEEETAETVLSSIAVSVSGSMQPGGKTRATIASGHIRWATTMEERIEQLAETDGGIVLPPDAEGKQARLVPTTPGGRRLVRAIERAITSGLKADDLPAMTPRLTDKQHHDLAREIDREVMRRGAVPLGVQLSERRGR